MEHPFLKEIFALATDMTAVKIYKDIGDCWRKSLSQKNTGRFIFQAADCEYKVIPAKHVDLALDYFNGKVEVQLLNNDSWGDITGIPSFYRQGEYRAKPLAQYIKQRPVIKLSTFITCMENGTTFYCKDIDGEYYPITEYKELVSIVEDRLPLYMKHKK